MTVQDGVFLLIPHCDHNNKLNIFMVLTFFLRQNSRTFSLAFLEIKPVPAKGVALFLPRDEG